MRRLAGRPYAAMPGAASTVMVSAAHTVMASEARPSRVSLMGTTGWIATAFGLAMT